MQDRRPAADLEAFAAQFEPLRPLVYRVACRLVGENEAEDVVMDTFLKAWQGWPAFRPGAALQPWLYRIAWNCAADHLRRRRLELRHGLRPGAEPPALELFPDSRSPSPADLAVAADDAAILRRAMAALPEILRTAMLLRHVDGLSYREIAAATGVRIGTVMSRLFQGRRRLRRLLAEAGVAPGAK